MKFYKSLYTIGIQCSKALWLKKYKSEVLAPTDESAEVRFKRVRSKLCVNQVKYSPKD